MKQIIQWAIATDKGRSEAASSAQLINLYAEALPSGAKSNVVLYRTPGLALHTTIPTTPIVNIKRMNDVLYVATNTNLYKLNDNGSYVDLGALTLNDSVQSAENGTHLVFVDGVSGYAYSKADGLQQFSGDGWYPSDTVTQQDGYFIFVRKGTQEFFISQLLSVVFDPSDYASAEANTDILLASLSDHRELWNFGSASIEVWYNSGNADFPFERLQGASIEKGVSAIGSIAKVDNSIVWIGDDRIIYRASGYIPVRISTNAVEFDIRDGVISDATSYSYTDEGHTFYVLTFPTKNKTWCYDFSTGLWHERSSSIFGRQIPSCYEYCYNKHFVGDFNSGNVYMLDMNALTDNDDPIIRTAISPVIQASRNRMIIDSLEINIQAGVGTVSGQGEDPQAMLQWSNDNGKNWSNEHWRKMGKLGKYLTRIKWNRLGMFRQRIFKLVISDPVDVVIIEAVMEARSVDN